MLTAANELTKRRRLLAGAVLLALLVGVPLESRARAQGAAQSGPAVSRPTVTPTPTPTSTPTSTPTPLPASHALNYLLYAARVSPANSLGNLEGLAAVSPGSKVWLMMYYVVRSLPGTMQRVTRYIVSFRGKTVFKASFSGTIGPSETGRFSRYIPYTLPRSSSFGHYVFQAELWIGGKRETKVWEFTVARHSRLVLPGSAPTLAERANFLLYAARVSPVNTTGDMQGLSVVSPGSRVWLMMYYVVESVPAKLSRITRYIISSNGKTVFRASFHGTIKPSETGRFSRYTPYTVPTSMHLGRYVFQAVLWIGDKKETKVWEFSVGKSTR